MNFSLIFLLFSFAIVGYGNDLDNSETPIADLSGQKLDDTTVAIDGSPSYDGTDQPVSSTPPTDTKELSLPDPEFTQASAANFAEQVDSNQDLPSDEIVAARPGQPSPGERGRGPPQPANPDLRYDSPGYWPGYPHSTEEIELEDYANPITGFRLPIRQPKGSCTKGKLYCCQEVLIRCFTFYERAPECIPDQQQCCADTDEWYNGIDCKKAKQRKSSEKPQEPEEPGQQNPSNYQTPGACNWHQSSPRHLRARGAIC